MALRVRRRHGCVRNDAVYERLQRIMRVPTDNVRRGCILKKPKGQVGAHRQRAEGVHSQET
eukprot:120299-Prorocentrum_minimum.AAC.3